MTKIINRESFSRMYSHYKTSNCVEYNLELVSNLICFFETMLANLNHPKGINDISVFSFKCLITNNIKDTFSL